MLSWIKWGLNALGLSSIAGTGTLILGVVLAMSAAATWLREDAINDCDGKWKLQLAMNEIQLQKDIAAKAAKITELEKKLQDSLNAADIKATEDDQHLKEQRDATQLSDDCKRCRVPNARIWVREGGGGVPVAQSSRPTARAKDGPSAPR